MSIAESELAVGTRVVYPNQGICRVVGTLEMEIAGRKESFIKLSREDNDATVMVPTGRLARVGLRKIADTAELQKVFDFLAAPLEGPELDWKVRHRSHGERMSEGGLMALAEVVKGLTALADLRPLPPKERELYDNARHLLVAEVAAAASLSPVSAEDAVDFALFPPGVERKKVALAIPLPISDGDDLGMEDEGAVAEEALPDVAEVTEAAEPEGEEAIPEEEAEAVEAEEPPRSAPRAATKLKAAAKKAAPSKALPAKPKKPAPKPPKPARSAAKPAKAPAAKKDPAKKASAKKAKPKK